MKTCLYLIFFLFCFTTIYAQTGKLNGQVLDSISSTGLEAATVNILSKDSVLINYKLSDKNGNFFFEKLPVKKELLVSITYVGYHNFSRLIRLESEKTDSLRARLSLNLSDSNAVTVSAAIPIRMEGDTLVITPAAFKMKPDAVVEEMLNQVPGVTIWSDGTITVNGQKVKNFLVDGKPFLGSTDPRLATQNLPKTAIEKIQVYQEYDRTSKEKQKQRQDSILTMNLQLKEGNKAGYFGKISAGYGSSDRYEGDLSFQMYNKKTSFGIGGGLNNINKDIGNLEQLFQNNTYRNQNPNLYYVGQFGSDGINKNHSIGAVLVHNFIETSNSRQNNRLSLNYNKSGSRSFVTDQNMRNRTTPENPQFEQQEGLQNNTVNRNEIGINYIKTSSYNDELTVNGRTIFDNRQNQSTSRTEVRNPAGQLLSSNTMASVENGKNDNESVDLNFLNGQEDEPLKNFRIRYNLNNNRSISDRTVESLFKSYTETAKDTAYNRQYHTTNNTFNTGVNLEYQGFKRLLLGRYNLFGMSVSFNQWFNYTRSSGNTRVTDFDSRANTSTINQQLSNQNKRELFEYTPYLTLSKTLGKYSGKFYRSSSVEVKLIDDIKTDKNQSSIANRNLNRSFQFFRYEGTLSHWYNRHNQFTYQTYLNYRKDFGYASIDQLHPVVDDINAYEIRKGSPHLQNQVNHNLSVYTNFQTQNSKSAYTFSVMLNGDYTRSFNPVTDSILNDPSGKRIYYYINADQSNRYRIAYETNISRRIKKSSIQLRYNAAFNNGRTPNYIDNIYTISKNFNNNHNIDLQFSLRSLMIFNIGEALTTYRTQQTGQGLTSFKNTLNTTRLSFTLNYPAGFTFSSTLNYVKNSGLSKPTILWNAFASYRFMKQQGELKLSAMDLLKQYQNISSSADTYGTTTRITNGLQQYFLLTFSYYPRKFGKKDLKQKTTEQTW
ncbi:TonB-dependent receptor family protein [Niabella sp. CC-SYL272]|uniref:TonB-dependent receptor n=1 Tax=Niabella agricola TaxID=2891571 RepID=UPI001F4657F6|nr:TonB-dependent receptor [Niabella agricola]MCF3110072.1 TonB-dependent receptor family protein [Niabella agricola]